jgi:putative membrane-bound dehydrogenase-like protein
MFKLESGFSPKPTGARSGRQAWVWIAVILALCVAMWAVGAEPTPLENEHARLMFYRDAAGLEQSVRTPTDWQIRRKQILQGMALAMGDLPDRAKLDPPTAEVLEEVSEPAFTRQSLKITVDGEHSVPAWLYLPKDRAAETRLPVVLALHQTDDIGKHSVDGQGSYPDQRYGRELAERGYIVLAPDYPSFGDYPCDFSDPRFASGSILGVFNHMRCIDWLVSRDDVDAGRIGVIGHSLGGHNSMFLAAFDERVKAAVSSCGWDPFHYYIPGKLSNWGQDRYMPRVRSEFGSDPDRMPFDFYEVVAAIAPRAFLSISPLKDSNFNVVGVRKAVAEAEKVYRLLQAGDYLQLRSPDVGHCFPDPERQAAYAFLDQHLRHTPPGAPTGLAAELPRIPPHEPDDAKQTFSIIPGFGIELAACEPLVHSPVALAFDESGAMFVVEMCDYSEQDKDFLGKVRRLEDTDGDGRYDRSTVYVDHLSWPTAVICFDGGIFVGAAPDIFYCKDTNGDGHADIQKVVFTGFGRSNVQGLLNSFQWGLDSRIHAAVSSSGGMVRHPDDPPTAVVNLNGRDLSFDPRTLELRPESGGAQHGLTFDDWGRKYVCSNSDHLQLMMYEDRYMARNPLFAAPSARRSIAADGAAAEVFRTSPVEPWRIVRTRLRIADRTSGGVEGGGRASGYFTGATGTTCYRGDAFPTEMRHQVFVGDVGSNLVHRKELTEEGIGLIGRRIDEGREFLASSDIWFRPAQFANGPDGALYIADVYREVIEHPASLPPEIKQHLDLTSGRDRGRVWRVVPDGFVRPREPNLGKASTAELVAALENRGGWHRDTAARLLFERQDSSATAGLERLSHDSKTPEARMLALYVLAGMKSLKASVVLTALDDPHPHVREHAVRLAERLAGDPQIAAKLCGLTADSDNRVRYQLAFSLGELPEGDRDLALAHLARSDGAEPLVQAAIFSSLFRGAGNVLVALLADNTFSSTGWGEAMLEKLATQVGRQGNADELAMLEAATASLRETDQAGNAVVRGVILGRSKAPAAGQFELPTQMAAALARILKRANQVAANEAAPLGARVEATRTLNLGTFAEASQTLTALVDSHQPQEVQLAAVETLGRFSDPVVGTILTDAWPHFSPRLRATAGEILFSRPQWVTALLDSIDSGRLALADFDPARLRLLESSAQDDLRARLEKMTSKLQTSPRQEVLAAYRSALTLPGQAARGRTTFQKSCASCHRLEGIGNDVGPSLSAIKNRGAEAILLNLLDPNREVNPQFVNYIAVLSDGRTLSGMLANETATSITLKRAENVTETFGRGEIDQLQSTRQSLMPEGLEKQLDPQAVADVIAYLLVVP